MMYGKVIPSFIPRKYNSYLAKGTFLIKNWLSFENENFGLNYSIFHNFRIWASFFAPFCTRKWILQPLTTNGMNTILEIKGSLCTCTPCRQAQTDNLPPEL